MRGTRIMVPVLEAPHCGGFVMRVGRFGWKDQHASLLSFAADAYRNEVGAVGVANGVRASAGGIRALPNALGRLQAAMGGLRRPIAGPQWHLHGFQWHLHGPQWHLHRRHGLAARARPILGPPLLEIV
jgi:hypothetical protein